MRAFIDAQKNGKRKAAFGTARSARGDRDFGGRVIDPASPSRSPQLRVRGNRGRATWNDDLPRRAIRDISPTRFDLAIVSKSLSDVAIRRESPWRSAEGFDPGGPGGRQVSTQASDACQRIQTAVTRWNRELTQNGVDPDRRSSRTKKVFRSKLRVVARPKKSRLESARFARAYRSRISTRYA